MDEKRVSVEIYGERIFIVSAEAETYLKSLAAYVDQKMIEIFRFRKSQGEKPMINCMLLGLNIADELFKEKQKNTVQGKTVTAQPPAPDKKTADPETEQLRAKNKKLYDENTRLKNDLLKKTKEIQALRKEFDDYIDTFGADGNGKA